MAISLRPYHSSEGFKMLSKHNCCKLLLYSIVITLLVTGWVARAGPAGPNAEEPQAELERLIAAALADNPELAALRDKISAAQAVVPQAGALDDPQLTVALSNMPVGGFSFERTPMSGIQFMLRQMVPYPGKLGLRELAARQGVEITREMYQEAENAVVRLVKQGYNNLYYLHRAIEVTQMNKQIAEALAELSGVMYGVGKIPQQHLIKANVEVARYVDRLVILEEKLDRAEAALNVLLDRPPNAPLPDPQVGTYPFELSAAALYDVAREQRPSLQEMRGRIARLEILVRLARKDLKPDFVLGFDYRVRANSAMDAVSGADFWSFSVGANLPWLNKKRHESRITEQQAHLDAAVEQERFVLSKVREALDNALEAATKSHRQVDLYSQGLIPEAELSFSAARTAYEVGKVDMLAVLDALTILNKFQQAYYRVVADHENAVADLEFVVGQRLY